MVDCSCVLLMAAPSDPLSLQLQSQRTADRNVTTAPNAGPWGTWEELLLGSAVLKHGADNWALVAQELQSRARAGFCFTPEACRAGYQAIQLRFGAADAGRGGPLEWYEELRRLRVAHLKRELEQYDSSIGSLESKIKRLQSEGREIAKSRTSHVEPGVGNSNDAVCKPALHGVAYTQDSKDPCAKLAAPSGEDEADGDSSREETWNTPNVSIHQAIDPMPDVVLQGACDLKKQSNGAMNGVHDGSGRSLIQHYAHTKHNQDEQPPSSNSTLYLSASKSDTSSKEQEKLSKNPGLSIHSLDDGGRIEGRSFEFELPGKSLNDPNRNAIQAHEKTLHLSISDKQGEDGEDASQARHTLAALHSGVLVKMGEAPQGNLSSKLGVSPSLKSVNIDESKKIAKSPYAEDDDASRKSDDESESLCSPRVTLQTTKHRQNMDRSAFGPAREVFFQDEVDDKRHVRKALGEKNFADTMSNRPAESADSTEGKGQQVMAVRASNIDALAGKVKKEVITCKEEDETLPGLSTGRDEKDYPRKVVVVGNSVDKKVQSTSSTENSLHCEVWGESAEVANKELKPSRKRRRLVGRMDRKHRAAKADDSRGKIDSTPHASSVKTEFLTTSHEASESMQSPGGKEEMDREVWNEGERLSGDSRYEKSEVGSYVDGNDDVSPMSRRNRREPKVSGKRIPLLESLRAICAHKCGHFFRHNHELENDRYFQVVRLPIDLGTIRTRLEEGHYSCSMHFFRDLLLMVSNAMVYYPKESSENMAAVALRECVLKEMEHVFENEALLKQEGPSFRKRDSRQMLGQGRRKGALKLLSSVKRTSREREHVLKQSEANAGVESGRLSHQSLTPRLFEGAWEVDKGVDGKTSVSSDVDVHKIAEGSDAKKSLSNNKVSTELSSSIRSDTFLSEKVNELKERIGATSGKVHEMEAASHRSPSDTRKDTTIKSGSFENATEKKAGFVKAGGTPVLASHKGKETGNPIAKAGPSIQQEPVKRGVGRPPKHAQQGLSKAMDVVDTSVSTRKRSRR